MVFDPVNDTYKPGNNNGREEVDPIVILFSVGGFGWLPVTFKVGKRTTKQALYIRKVQVIYLKKTACIDVGIFPPDFPKPMTSPSSVTGDVAHPDIQRHKIDPPENKHKFIYPQTPPYQREHRKTK